jgi:hypothetical protein
MNILLESTVDKSEIKSSFDNVRETAIEWIAYSFNEYELYTRYDQFTVTLAGLLNTFANEGLNNSIANLKAMISKVGVDVNLVYSCMNEMFMAVHKSDPETMEECSTQSGSSEVRLPMSAEKEPKEFVGKKRRRLSCRRGMKQAKISQYMKQVKVTQGGRNKKL